jgi:ABC-2 type transport system ATP-binding protein
LEFIARAYKLTDWRKRAESLMDQFNLIDEQDKMGTDLSKGMKQKLSICCALLIEPQMLLFDEPFIGLDPQAIVTVKNVIREQKANGCSILISTHMLNMVDGMWDRAYIMSKGEVATVVDNSVKNLEEMFMELTLNKES